MDTKVVSAKEVAAALGVKPETVRAWHRRGWIPAYRAGRRPVMFVMDEVRDALAARAAGEAVRDGR